MYAMRCEGAGRPLAMRTLPRPEPGPGQVQVRVRACGVCRTDLHLVDGELPAAKIPVIPGHEIVGVIAAHGPGVDAPALGARVGVPWLGYTCGHCRYCASGRENLCADARFTGCQQDGGYAEYAIADARYVFPLPGGYDDLHAAPLLCAGLIGYRAYRMAGDARTLGLYGFGAAAHLVAQIALAQGRTVYAFTRPGDRDAQAFALSVGAHMPYRLLWGERSLRSVANLTRRDGCEFLALAAAIPLTVHVEPYPLSDANEALARLRAGAIAGAAVLTPVR